MTGYFETLTNNGALPALLATWSFTGARHALIAENIANAATPGYKARRLDYPRFQEALDDALERKGGSRQKPFVFEGDRAHTTDDAGMHHFQPARRPGRSVVKHDGTNVSLEREMADMAANAMLHELTTNLVSGYFDGIRKAIRGRI